MVMRRCVLVLQFILCLLGHTTGQLDESSRLAEYYNRNYTWPLPAVNPNTSGWNELMRRRMAQVERVESTDDRYNGWVSVMSSSIVAPNFTELGWGLTRAPPEVVAELKASLHANLATAQEEHFISVIESEVRPLFIRQEALNRKMLEALRPMHEQWSGVPLTGAIAYGLRAYRNNTVLHMHVDRLRTHVISSILHVDHSEDSEPWPILIEGFDGTTNEVVLHSGDMLFYESSKCIHGRPRRFKGSWYSSLFIHYFPTGWNHNERELETHYAIPPHWHMAIDPDPNLATLKMIGTSMSEPDCPDGWCASVNSKKLFGPAIDGIVLPQNIKLGETNDREEL